MTVSHPTTYVLDTNVLIEAYQRYYPLDVCPGFWDCLTHYCEDLRLCSIDRVRDEIAEGDELSDWVRKAPHGMFVSTADSDVVYAFQRMMLWVQNNSQFSDAAKAEFASVADGWLAAYALAQDAILVTQEVFNPDVKRRVPLPNVCEEFAVSYRDTISMLRDLEVRFEWMRTN